MELITGVVWSSEPKVINLQNALKVSKQHFDLFSFSSGEQYRCRLGQSRGPYHERLYERAQNHTIGLIEVEFWFESAYVARESRRMVLK